MKPALEYILSQPAEYKEIIYYVCEVIEKEIPEATLLYKWKVPFYYIGTKPFCYINVSHKRKFVDVAFFHGNQLKKHQEYLNSHNRTQIKSLRYFDLNSFPDDILRDIIREAKEI